MLTEISSLTGISRMAAAFATTILCLITGIAQSVTAAETVTLKYNPPDLTVFVETIDYKQTQSVFLDEIDSPLESVEQQQITKYLNIYKKTPDGWLLRKVPLEVQASLAGKDRSSDPINDVTRAFSPLLRIGNDGKLIRVENAQEALALGKQKLTGTDEQTKFALQMLAPENIESRYFNEWNTNVATLAGTTGEIGKYNFRQEKLQAPGGGSIPHYVATAFTGAAAEDGKKIVTIEERRNSKPHILALLVKAKTEDLVSAAGELDTSDPSVVSGAAMLKKAKKTVDADTMLCHSDEVLTSITVDAYRNDMLMHIMAIEESAVTCEYDQAKSAFLDYLVFRAPTISTNLLTGENDRLSQAERTLKIVWGTAKRGGSDGFLFLFRNDFRGELKNAPGYFEEAGLKDVAAIVREAVAMEPPEVVGAGYGNADAIIAAKITGDFKKKLEMLGERLRNSEREIAEALYAYVVIHNGEITDLAQALR